MLDVRRSRRPLWFVPAAFTLAACNGAAPKAQPLSLSLTSRSAAPAAAPGASADLQIGSGANSLSISQAQMVLSRIELSPSGSCSTSTMGEEEDDCDELEAGPTLVDLPVDGTTKVILDALVPPGTYSELQAKLDAVTPDEDEPGASTFLQMHPDFQGISVKVTGVFTDASSQDHPFTFTVEADAEIEAAFQPPVTVDATTTNLTIDVNVASWFTDASGAAIDPTNPANAATIEQNIRRSFRAFEDDNHDGQDDHEQGGDNSVAR